MAEEIVEQDLGNVQQMDNAPEGLDNVQQMDNVPEDLHNVPENLHNVLQIDNVAEDLDNVQQIDNVPEGLDNVQQIDNVAEDFDNVQQMDNVPEDLHNVQQIDNVAEDLDNVPEGLDNVQQIDNVPEDLDNVQKIDNVPEDLDNVQQMDNLPEDLDNVQQMDHVPEDLGNVQQMDNVDNVPEILHSQEERKGDEDDSRVAEEKWPGWPGENVFRMLVPVQRVGGIIGRKGEYIKKVCEETRARIKILDGPPGTTERAVLVSAKEEPDLPIPPALDGLLKIHKRIIDPDSDAANAQSGGTVCTRLLVAATHAGSLIGKQGATIKTIQDDSNCTIRVLGGENLPMFALPDDSLVEIQGEPTSVHKAVELIASHLRKFLVDRSVVGVFEMQMQNTRASHNAPPPQSWGPTPSAFPMNPHGHGSNPPFMAPHPRQYNNYYPPAGMSPLDKHPRSGPPTYGRDLAPNAQPQQAVIAKVTQNMQIPLSYADAVIGVNGANISYIRRASGATIAIQETKGVPGEMTIEINGSASQVQAAQQLIQNSLADAVSSAQANHGGGPPSQGYNPYASAHGPVYGSQVSNSAGQGGHVPTGDYGSTYGGSYGY